MRAVPAGPGTGVLRVSNAFRSSNVRLSASSSGVGVATWVTATPRRSPMERSTSSVSNIASGRISESPAASASVSR